MVKLVICVSRPEETTDEERHGGSDGQAGAVADVEREVGAMESRIRAAGQRLTASRRSILQVVASFSEPFQASELCEKVAMEQPNVGRASVFRTLALLEAHGLVERVHSGGHERYVACKREEHHHHLICTGCGSSEEFELDLDDLFRSTAAERGFTLSSHVIDLFGLCTSCQEKDRHGENLREAATEA